MGVRLNITHSNLQYVCMFVDVCVGSVWATPIGEQDLLLFLYSGVSPGSVEGPICSARD